MQAKFIRHFKMKIRLQICQLSEFFKNLKGHRVFNYQHTKLKISKIRVKYKIKTLAMKKIFKIIR